MKRLVILLVAMTAWVWTQAEVVTLKSGAQVRGTIVMQNDEVVILRDASGMRMQYPRKEVVKIEQEASGEGTNEGTNGEWQTVGEGHPKKASILLEVGAGIGTMPYARGDLWGLWFTYNADLLVGTHNLAGKKIFLGGGVGYHGDAVDPTMHFLPIQAALRAPLMQTKHAPMVGVSLGYGVALSKEYTGGIYTDLMLGYRYEINSKSSFAISADLQFQQATMTVTEVIKAPATYTDPEEAYYTNKAGRSLIRTGFVKFSFFF